ncbi:MFS transporter [Desulfotomaculum copahuensis]|uniref:Major facilitator superfamily (MFS) profile domain-containing protein n=1 Tax=Desulfotomaculum copahuensis TaxID=1838280 RepID=A0A1B7LCS7_9FIRM|nr:MFS transporter [Desulfotomaculum copahuensis]OAT80717.1 hypothetical protein A6M21_12710 [Desulfotomaculum copahuensis]
MLLSKRTNLRQYSALIAVLLELLLIDLGSGLTMPVLPLYAHSLGAGIALTGTIVGTIGISRMLTDLPAGYLANKISRRKLLCASPLLILAAAIISAATHSYWLLIPARLLEGAGAALVNTITMITLADLVANKPNRGRIMSLYQSVRRGGNGIGPLLGGVLADILSFRAVYVIYAILAFASFIWASVSIRDAGGMSNRGHKPGQEGEKRELARFLHTAGFILISAMAFTFFFGRVASRRLIIPMLGQQTLGLSASVIGLSLTLATGINLLTLFFLGNLPDRIGARPVVYISGFLSAAALAFYALSNSLALFVLASLLWGFCSGFGGPARNIFLMDITPRGLYSMAVGVYRTVSDTGFVLGPFVLGLIGAAAGFKTALYAAASLFILVSVIFFYSASRRETVSD